MTPELVDEIAPDVLIVAVGAEQVVPKIPGIESKNVRMAMDVFGHENEIGENVVIVGGGLVGCELSIHLSEADRNLSVVEMTDTLCSTAQLTERMHTLEIMEQKAVKTLTEKTVTKIDENGVYVKDVQGREIYLPADTVIISVGTKPRVAERDVFKDAAFDVINIGDCVKASDICHAVHSGFDAGIVI